MFDFAAKFADGLTYAEFLDRHATDAQRAKWSAARELVEIPDDHADGVRGWVREMPVLCLAGAWCGDCVSQCPIFDAIAALNPNVKLRFFDRDAHPDLGEELQVCGAHRVPVVQFCAEDFAPVGRYGDRTLAKYRAMSEQLSGAACSTGANEPAELRAAVTAEWIRQFERNQLILRTSGRLREKHGD